MAKPSIENQPLVQQPANAVATPTAYYLPGSATNYITGLPTALWLPRILTVGGGFGFQTNQFGFNISWANGWIVGVDACTNLTQAAWSPVTNLTISVSNGLSYFGDSEWTNYPGRFYHVRY